MFHTLVRAAIDHLDVDDVSFERGRIAVDPIEQALPLAMWSTKDLASVLARDAGSNETAEATES